MFRNFNLPGVTWPPRTPAAILQLATVVLLCVNLVAAWFVWRPLGGSPADLDQQMVDLRGQVLQRRVILERTRRNVSKVETGRTEGDNFMRTYFLGDRVASMSILGELVQAARDSKVTPKEHALATEPIEGSDNLAMMSINGNYEATYADLMQFINRIDRSPRLVIVESLNATPQTGATAKLLNVNMKLNAFVRQDTVEP